jgi:DNA-binding response OmpR family regulator
MATQLSVLLVEPDRLIRESLALRLCRAGYSVTELRHPRQALAAAAGRSYDVVVLADEQPEIDGLSLLQTLRRRGSTACCVVITRDTSDTGTQSATDSRVVAVLPWSRVPNELEATIERVLEASVPESLVDLKPSDQPAASVATDA